MGHSQKFDQQSFDAIQCDTVKMALLRKIFLSDVCVVREKICILVMN